MRVIELATPVPHVILCRLVIQLAKGRGELGTRRLKRNDLPLQTIGHLASLVDCLRGRGAPTLKRGKLRIERIVLPHALLGSIDRGGSVLKLTGEVLALGEELLGRADALLGSGELGCRTLCPLASGRDRRRGLASLVRRRLERRGGSIDLVLRWDDALADGGMGMMRGAAYRTGDALHEPLRENPRLATEKRPLLGRMLGAGRLERLALLEVDALGTGELSGVLVCRGLPAPHLSIGLAGLPH